MSRPSSTLPAPPALLLRQPRGDGWWAFERVHTTIQAQSATEVLSVLEAAEESTKKGGWAVGFCCYEAAEAFDPALVTKEATQLPLAWFALCDPPRSLATSGLPPANVFSVGGLRPTVPPADHAAGVEQIQRWIALGDTYQVNYTHALEGSLEGDAWSLFLALQRGQRSAFGAWLDIGNHVVCSASPELFFELEGDRLVTRPMKGTAPRGRTTAEDRAQSEALAQSAKDRAENVMIVDMIRNDLGRVARPGSVRTTRLLDIERYETVFQMTSTIEASTEASVPEIFSALFPCASITGAPKVRTMQLIRELETGPRGLYTGAIGYLAPDRRARFSVAIRTATVARQTRALHYGTGGGVVWDSDADAERAECEAKARILTTPRPDFELLETLLWLPDRGYTLLDRHLERLADSAAYFDFSVAPEALQGRLDAAARSWNEAQRVRLTVDRAGTASVEASPVTAPPQPTRLALAQAPVDSTDPFLFHKTTHRATYERAFNDHPDADDVLLWNERRELTESTIANVVLEIDGYRLTPPVECGLLAGTLRAELLAVGEIRERTLTLDDLELASAIYLINSVRGWLPAALEPSRPEPVVDL